MTNYASFAPLFRRPRLADEIDRELGARSLAEFVRLAWVVVEPSTPFVDGWHIDAIIEHLVAGAFSTAPAGVCSRPRQTARVKAEQRSRLNIPRTVTAVRRTAVT